MPQIGLIISRTSPITPRCCCKALSPQYDVVKEACLSSQGFDLL